MAHDDKIQLFEDRRVRTAWDEEKEEWYFSIVDVVAVLTDQPDQRHAAKYWSVMKTRLKKEGSELPTNCSQLKMLSSDGKYYKTDVAPPPTTFPPYLIHTFAKGRTIQTIDAQNDFWEENTRYKSIKLILFVSS